MLRTIIAEHERGLLLENRSLVDVLVPGKYWILSPRRWVEIHDLREFELSHPLAEVFVKTAPELVERHFHVVRLGEGEAALVYRDGLLTDVLEPGSLRLYWKDMAETRVETLDVSSEIEVPAPVAPLLAHPSVERLLDKVCRFVNFVEVADQHVGLLVVDGRLARTLEPGLYAYWTFNRTVKVEHTDQRQHAMEIQGQEILTRDKVTLRVNMTAGYRITDPVTARAALGDVTGHLYRELQLGLRQAIGTRTLDQLLEAKGQLDQAVLDHVREPALAHGLTVTAVGVKDVILPGDMRELLNQVVEAEKVAQANVVKRREETAATRSLLNTAKLMDENPTLMRLKELEALEKVADKVERLTVFGGLDGVLKDTVRLGIKAD